MRRESYSCFNYYFLGEMTQTDRNIRDFSSGDRVFSINRNGDFMLPMADFA